MPPSPLTWVNMCVIQIYPTVTVSQAQRTKALQSPQNKQHHCLQHVCIYVCVYLREKGLAVLKGMPNAYSRNEYKLLGKGGVGWWVFHRITFIINTGPCGLPSLHRGYRYWLKWGWGDDGVVQVWRLSLGFHYEQVTVFFCFFCLFVCFF